MFHKLGLAKPLGFGSVKLGVKKIEILKPKERYGSITGNGWETVGDDKKKDWINVFKAAMKEKYNKDFDKLKNIADLNAILSSSNYWCVPFLRDTHPMAKFDWFMDNKEKVKYLWSLLLKIPKDFGKV